ncbi:MAG TPA: VOC family protein [Candidatus Angelobacter sp.]|nr:VOC family protein [Candidatus Angelobacter sp.]
MSSQTVFPMIAYENAAAAMDWLVRAFGFTERRRMTDKQGRVVHGELELSGNVVMVASPTPDYRSPRSHAESCPQAKQWLAAPWVIDGVLVCVDDVDAHFNRARTLGATMLSEIEEGGPGRLYRAADVEGHRWMFLEQKSS